MSYVLGGTVAVLLLGGMAGLLSWIVQRQRNRVTALRQLASSLCWRYVESEPAYTRQWQGEPFDAGRPQSADHVLVGRYRDLDVLVFDYLFVVMPSASNPRATTYQYQVWAVRMPAPPSGSPLDSLVGDRPARLRCEGDTLLSWETRLVDADEIVPRLDMMCRVLESAPSRIWREYGRTAENDGSE